MDFDLMTPTRFEAWEFALKRFYIRRGYGRYADAVTEFFAARPALCAKDRVGQVQLEARTVQRLQRMFEEDDAREGTGAPGDPLLRRR